MAAQHRAKNVVEAARSVVALHATDPATVYLSARARVDGMSIAALDRALYEERSLVKHLAMRRTLFVVPAAALGFVQAGASARVAAAERARLIRDVERVGLRRDGKRWLAQARRAVLAALADGREATATELREELAVLRGGVMQGEGRAWGGEFPVAPRVLNILSASGDVVRASNQGGWTTSRPRWATARCWLGDEIARLDPAEGAARLVDAWLRAFGPGTAADVKWWLGSTVAIVRRALADLGAVEVALDSGSVGYVLPDDLEPEDPAEPWAALLPSLDPTTMGWQERDWYLGPHRAELFDRAGNAGPTAWWDGRIVGGWCQEESGEVRLALLEDPGRDARSALEAEAERLTTWLDGAVVRPRFPTSLLER